MHWCALVPAALVVAFAAGPAPARAGERMAPPLSNADYWAFADRIMGRLDSW